MGHKTHIYTKLIFCFVFGLLTDKTTHLRVFFPVPIKKIISYPHTETLPCVSLPESLHHHTGKTPCSLILSDSSDHHSPHKTSPLILTLIALSGDQTASLCFSHSLKISLTPDNGKTGLQTLRLRGNCSSK